MGESITYEELFELLRRERNSEELQTLDPTIYKKLVSYFQSKKDVLEDTSEEAELFGSSEKEKVKVQLDNAKKIAKELIQRREKKIIFLALNRVRTRSDIIDTSALLEVEQAFFHKAVKMFTSFHKGVLENIVAMKEPQFSFAADIEDELSSEQTADSEAVSEEPEDDAPEAKEDASEEKTAESEADNAEVKDEDATIDEVDSEEKEVSESAEGVVKVKFKSSIPKFMGKNEQVYGPFEEEETAEISSDIAQVLIKKGRAESVE